MSEFKEFTHRFEVPAEPELLPAAGGLRPSFGIDRPPAFFYRLLNGTWRSSAKPILQTTSRRAPGGRTPTAFFNRLLEGVGGG